MDRQPPSPPIPPDFSDMNEVLKYFLAKIERLEKEVEECQHHRIEAAIMQNGALVRVMERSNQILDRLEKYLDKQLSK